MNVSSLGEFGAGMFTNQIVRFVATALGFGFAMFLGMQITNPDSNGLATALMWVAVASFITSILSPRRGVYLVLLMCPVLDLLKRSLVLFTTFDMRDVATVLAIAPITTAAALVGTFGSRVIFGKNFLWKGEKPLFVFLVAANVLVIVSIFFGSRDESTLHILQTIAESCSYLGLLFLVSVHFPEQEDVARFFRAALLVFTPVALYGIWQLIFGISDMEVRYLMSGMTIIEDDFQSSGRIFSTLNSNHSFSVTMACLALIALLQRYMPASTPHQKRMRKWGILFFLLFAALCFLSLRRTGWAVIAYALIGFFCFQSRIRTWIFYSVSFGGLLFTVLNARNILIYLPLWEDALRAATNDSSGRLNLQTFNDRLFSFDTLLNSSEIWTLFGMPAAQQQAVGAHDAITQTVIAYGAVGLFAFLMGAVVIMIGSHRVIFRVGDTMTRKYAALLLSFIFSNLFVGVVMQSHITIFPINFLFWFCVGALLEITFKNPETVIEQPVLKPRRPRLRLATAGRDPNWAPAVQ